MKRTITQNSAIHKYFELLAEALNDAGYDVRTTLKEDFKIAWGKETVKELLWKPIQNVYVGEKSTTKLTTKDIDKIYDIININIGEKTGVFVPFPSIEVLRDQLK